MKIDTPTYQMKRRRRTTIPKKVRMRMALQNPLIVRREVCLRDFYQFVLYFWDEISNDSLIDNWHIRYICKELQEVSERVGANKPKYYDLIINIPPGSSKTSIITILWPAWLWTRWYWIQIISASYSSILALEPAEKSRDLIRSRAYRQLFPELQIKKDKDNKTNFRITKFVQRRKGENPQVLNGGNRFSTSVGGTLVGFHGHVQIVDDPLSPEEAVSDVKLKTANRWIDQTLSTRKTNKEVSVLVLVMQRLHQNDPSGMLLAKKGKRIKHICLPGILEEGYEKNVKPEILKDKYTDGLLDPVRMNRKVLAEMKIDLGQYGYAGQVGQDPTPASGGMFQTDMIQKVHSPNAVGEITQKIRYWDKAGSQGKGAYTAGVLIGKTDKGVYIVLDVIRGRWKASKREEVIEQTARKDGVDTEIYIEQEPGSGGKESAEATIKRLDGYVCRADRPTGDKVYRADPFSVQVNNGWVYVLQADWNDAYMEELKFFPVSTYKDQVDASSGAYTKLNSKKQAAAW